MHMYEHREKPEFGGSGAKGAAELMDKNGVSKCLNSHITALKGDFSKGNDLMHRAMKKYPGKILGLCVIDPNFPGRIFPELDKRMAQGFAGVKTHPYIHGYFANGKNYHMLYEYAHKHRIFILSHTYLNEDPGNRFCDPRLFGELARNYKNARFILGHAGGAPQGHAECVKLANKYDNIYLEMCSTRAFDPRWLEKFVDKTGDDKIFFGSDAPFNSFEAALGKVLSARISDKSREKILYLNISRFLDSK